MHCAGETMVVTDALNCDNFPPLSCSQCKESFKSLVKAPALLTAEVMKNSVSKKEVKLLENAEVYNWLLKDDGNVFYRTRAGTRMLCRKACVKT